MLKKIIGILISILMFGLLLLLTIMFYGNQSKDLNHFLKYENTVHETGIYEGTFWIDVNGLNERFGVFRTFKNYKDLLNEIKAGDNLTIYYQPNSNNKEINADVIQIENGTKIILNQSEYKNKNRIMMVVTLIGCLYMIYTTYCFIKHGKVDNVIPPVF